MGKTFIIIGESKNSRLACLATLLQWDNDALHSILASVYVQVDGRWAQSSGGEGVLVNSSRGTGGDQSPGQGNFVVLAA